jgi:hypothetical protein
MEDSASEDDPPEYYPWEECGPADDTEDDNTPQPQHKGKEVDVVDPPKKITYIDLTGDAENCAHCADILGKGDGFAAHTFWFQRCGCVRFQSSPAAPSEIITFYSKVVCGHCMIDCLDDNVRWIDVDGQYNFSRRFSFCPKNTHFLRGKQVVLELFGTQCLICLGVTDDLPTRLRTPCGKISPTLPGIRPLTIVGHAFCRRCLREWVVTNKKRNCPTCNYDFVKGRICDWANFQTVQRGVTCEREVEPG